MAEEADNVKTFPLGGELSLRPFSDESCNISPRGVIGVDGGVQIGGGGAGVQTGGGGGGVQTGGGGGGVQIRAAGIDVGAGIGLGGGVQVGGGGIGVGGGIQDWCLVVEIGTFKFFSGCETFTMGGEGWFCGPIFSTCEFSNWGM